MRWRYAPTISAICAAFLIALLVAGCAGGKKAGHETKPATGAGEQFPEGFLWGVAGSAYQTEGKNTGSDFDVWNRDGHGKDICGQADRSYDLYRLDAELAASLGCTAYRVGIEWARIEPKRGQYDAKEILHYRQMLQSIVDLGMRPILTLHHFTNPIWVEKQGGWMNQDTVDRFVAFARLAASEYGDLVDFYLTINEPMVYTIGSYMLNLYPGGCTSCFDKTMSATVNMIFAHARAYRAIKDADVWDADGDGEATRISFAHSIIPPSPLDPNDPDDADSAYWYDYLSHRLFLRAVVNGDLDVNANGSIDDRYTIPVEGHYDSLQGTIDFLALNYYNPVAVKHVSGVFGPVQGVPCMPQADFLCYPAGRGPYIQGDNGNEIHPEGIKDIIEDFQDEFKLPVLISENGVAATDGYLRSWFIIEHLKNVHAAMDDGYDVMGYLYWSLLDNFEWLEGFGPRFGLFTVNYSDYTRTATEGGRTYSEIVNANGISPDLQERYITPPAPR